MKRLTLLLLGLALGVSATASAQGLTMQMSNGWSFSFSGNVNAFWVFSSRDSGPQGPKLTNSSIRTGLLPAFATFDARGKEGGLNLGVHIGFAPQIQNGGNAHDQFGTQIDMRQVYLTVGLKDGSQILAGRELGLFDRQNILNDMTLFGNQVQFSVGLFQPSVIVGGGAGSPAYSVTSIPRVEVEVVGRPKMSGNTKLMIWVGGEWQKIKRTAAIDSSVSAVGVTGGLKLDVSEFAIVASYYTGKGIGGVTAAGAGIGGFGFASTAFAGDGTGRKFDGGIAQVTYAAGKKTTVGASWGFTREKAAGTSSSDGSDAVLAQWSSYTGGVYHQWTKSLKLVAEYTREVNGRAGQSNQNIGAAGFMLFF